MHTPKQLSKLRSFIRIKEIVALSLVMISFGLLALEHLNLLGSSWLAFTEWYEIVLGCLFLTEFGFELHFARDKKRYWKYHWFYLLASVPVPMQTFEILRGLRLLRLLKVFAHIGYENNTRLFARR